MAARLRAKHQDEIREKIRTSQLVNVLEKHALGEDIITDTRIPEDERILLNRIMVERGLPASRMKAIEVLLRKTLSDLTSIEHSGDPENPVYAELRRTWTPPPTE